MNYLKTKFGDKENLTTFDYKTTFGTQAPKLKSFSQSRSIPQNVQCKLMTFINQNFIKRLSLSSSKWLLVWCWVEFDSLFQERDLFFVCSSELHLLQQCERSYVYDLEK